MRVNLVRARSGDELTGVQVEVMVAGAKQLVGIEAAAAIEPY